MKDRDDWLLEMMHAALEDVPSGMDASLGAALSLKEESRVGPERRFLTWRRGAAVAAAVILLGTAIPVSWNVGHDIASREASREMDMLFVDQLIGDTLFEEGLVGESSSVGESDEGLFDI